MKRQLSGLALLGAGMLSGCSMNGPSGYEVHEALLYGAARDRVTWLYGDLQGQPQVQVKLANEALTLRPQVQGPLAVPGTLSVNGKTAYLTSTGDTAPKITVTKDPGGTFTVQAQSNVDAVYFTDGQRWFKLSGALEAGAVVQASAQPNVALRGAGALTNAEADALGATLLGQGPLAVAVIPPSQLPDAALAAEPAPRAYLRTGLYVAGGVPTVSAPGPASPAGSANPASVAGEARVLERGANSAYSGGQPQVLLARTDAEFARVWRTATGNQLPGPQAPNVDFDRQSVVTFFLGQQPTGGYGLQFVSARTSGDTLVVTLDVRRPGAGVITTQALTSPWISLAVPGKYRRVVVQDTSGQVLARSGN